MTRGRGPVYRDLATRITPESFGDRDGVGMLSL